MYEKEFVEKGRVLVDAFGVQVVYSANSRDDDA